jgi:hypothetical protein
LVTKRLQRGQPLLPEPVLSLWWPVTQLSAASNSSSTTVVKIGEVNRAELVTGGDFGLQEPAEV